ncbi:MAG: hypothetical protein ACYS0I_14395 [Planctomycetota bacterium]|jgi:hypothetical protein
MKNEGNKATRRLLWIFVSILIGCFVFKPMYIFENFETIEPKRLSVVDLRLEIEKTLRPANTNKEGLLLFGDENFQPSRMILLNEYFNKELGEILPGCTVTIRKFELAYQLPSQKPSGQLDFTLGPILGGLIERALIPKEPYREGKFFVCKIQGDADGIEFKATSIEKFWDPMTGALGKKASPAVEKLIYRTLDIAIEQIKNNSKPNN